MRARLIVTIMSLLLLAALAGCYEDTGGGAQTQTPPPAAGTNPGPITGMGNQGNSALGAAKRSAENVVEKAEQRSREIEGQNPPGDN